MTVARRDRWVVTALLCVGLLSQAGCDGSSGSHRRLSNNNGNNGAVLYTAGVFRPYEGLGDSCAAPRTGTDPSTDKPYPDRQGSVATENNWLRSWVNDTYLWYDEVPDLDPNAYASTAEYFDLLKTSETTASGAPKDKFHSTVPTQDWEERIQSSVSLGYGVQWVLVSSGPPREIRIAYVEPDSPAGIAGVARGDLLTAVDGADVLLGNTEEILAIINAGLAPTIEGQSHQFTFRSVAGNTRSVTLQAAKVFASPVLDYGVVNPDTDNVGYIVFNEHSAIAEAQLIDVIEDLKADNVTDLILDVRYNGGGILQLASQLSYMIAGPSRTSGATFERRAFNDKHPSIDPVTGDPLLSMPFYTETLGLSAEPGAPLPTLNLNRVFVLTGSNTCSASESIINSLRGVGVEVIQIGGTTCGKPYGFYATPNCGTTYFAVQFQGVNHAGFGDYSDGFSPSNTVAPGGARVPGCSVADDLDHEFGDTNEARLSAAMQYRASGTCPTPPALSKRRFGTVPADGVLLYRSPMLENRILGKIWTQSPTNARRRAHD